MKAFNLFLADLNDGQTHAGLTADLDELLRTVRNTGRAGSMTLKIKISPASKGGEVDKIEKVRTETGYTVLVGKA